MLSQLEHDLLLAVQDGDEALVRTLLEAGADPNAGAWARFEHTAVSLAIENGYEAIFDELISRGLLYGMTEERGPQRIATKSFPRDTSIKATLQIWIANTMPSVIRNISSSWLPNETHSMSPGERALEAVLRSDAATESMVIKLLDANLLASQPYSHLEVARKLLDLAIERCWTTLASYLLEREAPVDTGPSEMSKECYWPSFFGSVSHTLPHIDAKVMPEHLLYRRKVISILDEYYIERSMQVSTWAKAVSSRVFHDLSRSKSEQERTTARVMLDVLRRSSANPSKPDDSGLDALSYAVQQAYPCAVFEEVLQAW
ncbi:hypothetical protein M409DRAFT_30310 [Zasmidium cellare ATCC 36951]|uniref:Uncharacterized protein n=1 Tax=Zasmidium cellare ATCC 36951 TaxID=1080233 RepID=A0A6A6BWH8_ZASCE|nr:uncharacterized protein M409DRAFT_30310 [Zasmidium cellare ATCC 36951]KAF2159171.1 hypothetical protein M409DRAFT_30310 [Zasmidium cellare ATCC 36951]